MVDVVVVGSGPNGLAAGVVLARAGLEVEVREAAAEIGGGLRSSALFDSRVTHDICAAVHPMAGASRFFREFGLAGRGVELAQPEVAFAHPLDDGRAGIAYRGLEKTCARLGVDAGRWRWLMGALAERSHGVVDAFLSDLRGVPGDIGAASRVPARVLAAAAPFFRGDEASALLAGLAAHSFTRQPSLPGGAIGVLLGHLAHATGWPVPRGGSARIAGVMADDILKHGGILHTGSPVTDIRELRHVSVVMLDLGPRGLLDIARRVIPDGYRRELEKYRYGAGAAKVDFLVSEAIPWTNEEVRKAGTVHLGGTRQQTFAAENDITVGRMPDEPFVLVSEPMVADPSRGLPGKRPVWAYAHVPHDDDTDPVDLVRNRIERYAPGFSDTVLAARGMSARQLGEYNPNYVGGDIGAGAISLRQLAARPVPRWDPYRTALDSVYLCSAATPPGPGVHGMCGYFAARNVLRTEFGVHRMPELS
jgi:phytoene dehydrogenase-like protein